MRCRLRSPDAGSSDRFGRPGFLHASHCFISPSGQPQRTMRMMPDEFKHVARSATGAIMRFQASSACRSGVMSQGSG